MLTIRKAEERGHANAGWLDSRHTFSFGNYHDPDHMGFGPLRVINEDRVQGGAGFPAHPHADMEIVTYVLHGALEHKDSLGTGSVVKPGDIQRMTAGTGLRHSEFNASKTDPVHFLQIWIKPETRGLQPGYEQKTFPAEDINGKLRLVGARDGRHGAITIHQDLALYAAKLATKDRIEHMLANGRTAWIQIARGSVSVNGLLLSEGDGAAVSNIAHIKIEGTGPNSEILLFDLAA